MTFSIATPKEFSYEYSLAFLSRSPKEVMHTVDGVRVHKLISVDGSLVFFSIEPGDNQLIVTLDIQGASATVQAAVTQYVREWFDLETDLAPFYSLARRDAILKPLIKSFHGYRIMGQPDLFESIVWAVLGQQINVAFAYTIKQRFVETFGQRHERHGRNYFLFPAPERVAALTVDDLLPLQFSRQKATYTIGIAQEFLSGALSREQLVGLSLSEAKERLVKIKGIGNWTANYALMRTFRYPDAFPLEDVALHKALRLQHGLRKKPSLDRVKKLFKPYRGWEAYATIYLWKSL